MPRILSSRQTWKLYSIALLIPIVIFQLKTLAIISVNHRHEEDDVILKQQQQKAQQRTNNIAASESNSNEFNYTLFWERAMSAAERSLQQALEHKQPQRPCPKVYVYNEHLADINNKYDITNKPGGFGIKVPLDRRHSMLQGHLYKTNQYSFSSILLERLLQSQECYTTDPNEADLFYAPVLPAPKDSEMWKKSCSHVSGELVKKSLVYLNTTNACKHFLAVGKSHSDVLGCDGWFSNPISELRPIARLAYSNYSFVTDKQGAHEYDKHHDATTTTNSTHPNLYSIPYPSSIHFFKNNDTLLESLYHQNKSFVMSFMGKDAHGDVPVRKRIGKFCRKYSKQCDYQKWRGIPDFIVNKARATFCLEPAGDTPGRKSLSDSITFGCIPVLFSELSDDTSPWHWLEWKDRARILVPRDDFVADRIDLNELFKTMPPKLLQIMKNTLKEKARQFQYSLDDDQRDGIRIILDNLVRIATNKEKQGLCGY